MSLLDLTRGVIGMGLSISIYAKANDAREQGGKQIIFFFRF